MQSHLMLNLVTAVSDAINTGHLPHFCSWPIQYALAKLITVPEGQILRQSHSHYLVHIDLFEYVLNEEITINFTKTHMSIFMFAMLEGHAMLYDQKNNFISEVKGNSCHFGYYDEGDYHVRLDPGIHKFLVLTFRPEWFLHETKNLQQFKSLIINYNAKKPDTFSLPYCRLTKQLNHSLKKMLLQKKVSPDSFFCKIQSVLSKLIRQYDKMLAEQNYTTKALHEIKAMAIKNFIQDNFKDQVVDNIPKLAQHIGVSEKTFQRLSKLAFGKPCRKQVITLRMEYVLHMLNTTKIPIYKIAHLAGYHDRYYFSRAFKKYYGESPAHFRRVVQNISK